MCIRIRSLTILLVIGLAALAVLVGCSAPSNDSTPAASAAPGASLDKGGQEEFGPYELVENWPQPLEDSPDGVKHEGWTWGSVGAVFAETPDRIWIAQRGELPLPAGAKPWTPYGALTPARVSNGNDDGSTPTCDPEPKRGWERRYHHVIFVVDRNGKMVQWWQDLDKIQGTRVPTSSMPSTASRSARTAGFSSWIAGTGGSKSSTRTASSSTCLRPASGHRPMLISLRRTSSCGSPTAVQTGSSNTI